MKHTLPPLPYAYDALEPHIDAKTMEIHHTKHHQMYVDKLNAALEKHPKLFDREVVDLLKTLTAVPEDIRTAVRNHGGGHHNHSLFWKWMTPHANERAMPPNVKEILSSTFGSVDAFKEKFSEAALNRFGSGWAWLVLDKGKLAIISTANQDSPLMEGTTPLLGLDVWEHAYYVRYFWNRAEYIKNWWHVVNWAHVGKQFKVDERIISGKK